MRGRPALLRGVDRHRLNSRVSKFIRILEEAHKWDKGGTKVVSCPFFSLLSIIHHIVTPSPRTGCATQCSGNWGT